MTPTRITGGLENTLTHKTIEEIDERLRVLGELRDLMQETGRRSYGEMTDPLEKIILNHVFPGGYDMFNPWDDAKALLRERMKRNT